MVPGLGNQNTRKESLVKSFGQTFSISRERGNATLPELLQERPLGKETKTNKPKKKKSLIFK